jgi:phosphohistidine phosphatase
MRRLMLLRHAKTERAAPGESDRDRRLTKRGRADASTLGSYMARHRLLPDLALVSPARRAQETWMLAIGGFDKAPPLVNDERIYNATTETLMAVIGESRDARSIILVGHNPSLHDLAVQLIAAGDDVAHQRVTAKLPTSGLVVIDFDIDEWPLLHRRAGRLERFVTPNLIAAATD